MGSVRVFATAAVAFWAALVLAQPSHAEPQGKVASTTIAPSRTGSKGTEVPRRPLTRRAASSPQVSPESDNKVMRGPDTIALIARLPWWRATEMETIRYPDKETVSQVLANAELWLATRVVLNPSDEGDDLRIETTGRRDVDDGERTAGEPESVPLDATVIDVPKPVEESFWQSIFAMLGGVLAAMTAGRYLFA